MILLLAALAVATAVILVLARVIEFLDFLYLVSTIKLISSLVKYIPQVMLNYRLKSTAGWSIHNVLLDLLGGVLSEAQLFYDSAVSNNWEGIIGQVF